MGILKVQMACILWFLLCTPLTTPELIRQVLLEPWMTVADLPRLLLVHLSEETVVVELPPKRLENQGLKIGHEYHFNEPQLVVYDEIGVVSTPLDHVVGRTIIYDLEKLGNKWFNFGGAVAHSELIWSWHSHDY